MADIRLTASSGKKAAGNKVSAKKTSSKTTEKTITPSIPRKAPGKKTAVAKPQVDTKAAVTPEERRHMIAEAAYLRAESRGFTGGDPNEDWLIAESEIDKILSRT